MAVLAMHNDGIADGMTHVGDTRAGETPAQVSTADGGRAAPGRPAATTPWPRARSLGALLTGPRVTARPVWVMPSLLESGEVGLLSAPPKTGKSTLVAQLAAELSRGGCALDGTPLISAPVLWFALDEPVRRLVPRLVRLGADREQFHIVEREPGSVLTATSFATLLAEHRPALVVIDTTSQLAADARVDTNVGAEVGPFLRPLVDAVRAAATPETPCAGLFVHHAPHHASRAAGSFQWGAIVDADLVLRRPRRTGDQTGAGDAPAADAADGDNGVRLLKGVTRAGGPISLRLIFNEGRYAPVEAPQPLIDRVRALLTTGPTGPGKSSTAAIRERLGCRQQALVAVLAELEQGGEVAGVGSSRTSPSIHFVPNEVMRQLMAASPDAASR